MSTPTDLTNYSKCFNPKLESVDEFIARFKLQNKKALAAEDSDGATLIANSLPINIITDLQRRLQPISINDATYDQIETHLLAAYRQKKTFIGASVAFINRKQKTDESIEEYSKSLNELATQCKYKVCCRDEILRDIFLSGIRMKKVLTSLITDSTIENKSFQDCVTSAKLIEQALRDVEDINPDEKHYQQATNSVEEINKVQQNRTDSGSFHSNKVPANYTCIRCGTKAKHFARNCFALNVTCNKCSKTGHLAKVCKSKGNVSYVSSNLNNIRTSNQMNEEEEDPAHYVTINSIAPDCKIKEGNISNKYFL